MAGQGFQVKWNGDQIRNATIEACRQGVNATLADCVLQSQQPGYVPVKSGTLKGSLRFEPAQTSGSRTIGSFGSYDVTYAIWQEIGTRFMLGKQFLRRSADIHFPTLPSRIKEFVP